MEPGRPDPLVPVLRYFPDENHPRLCADPMSARLPLRRSVSAAAIALECRESPGRDSTLRRERVVLNALSTQAARASPNAAQDRDTSCLSIGHKRAMQGCL